jgi:hypothetical protein
MVFEARVTLVGEGEEVALVQGAIVVGQSVINISILLTLPPKKEMIRKISWSRRYPPSQGPTR